VADLEFQKSKLEQLVAYIQGSGQDNVQDSVPGNVQQGSRQGGVSLEGMELLAMELERNRPRAGTAGEGEGDDGERPGSASNSRTAADRRPSASAAGVPLLSRTPSSTAGTAAATAGASAGADGVGGSTSAAAATATAAAAAGAAPSATPSTVIVHEARPEDIAAIEHLEDTVYQLQSELAETKATAEKLAADKLFIASQLESLIREKRTDIVKVILTILYVPYIVFCIMLSPFPDFQPILYSFFSLSFYLFSIISPPFITNFHHMNLAFISSLSPLFPTAI
jgi:hypothetical protein